MEEVCKTLLFNSFVSILFYRSYIYGQFNELIDKYSQKNFHVLFIYNTLHLYYLVYIQ